MPTVSSSKPPSSFGVASFELSKVINQTQAYDDFSSIILGPFFGEYSANLIKVIPFDHTTGEHAHDILPIEDLPSFKGFVSSLHTWTWGEKMVIHFQFVEWTNRLHGRFEYPWKEAHVFDTIQLCQ